MNIVSAAIVSICVDAGPALKHECVNFFVNCLITSENFEQEKPDTRLEKLCINKWKKTKKYEEPK